MRWAKSASPLWKKKTFWGCSRKKKRMCTPQRAKNFSQLKWALKEAVTEVAADGTLVETAAEVSVKFGNTIAIILDFIIIAFAVFCMVKALNNLHRKKEEPAPEPAPEPEPPAPTTEELLAEIRDLLKNK